MLRASFVRRQVLIPHMQPAAGGLLLPERGSLHPLGSGEGQMQINIVRA